jgi:hypothetical protein
MSKLTKFAMNSLSIVTNIIVAIALLEMALLITLITIKNQTL